MVHGMHSAGNNACNAHVVMHAAAMINAMMTGAKPMILQHACMGITDATTP